MNEDVLPEAFDGMEPLSGYGSADCGGGLWEADAPAEDVRGNDLSADERFTDDLADSLYFRKFGHAESHERTKYRREPPTKVLLNLRKAASAQESKATDWASRL